MKTLQTKNNFTLISIIVAFMFAIAYFYCAFNFFYLNAKDIMLFAVILLVSIQIPGNLILRFFKMNFHSAVTKYPTGFFCGFGVLTFVYYLSIWLDSVFILYLYTGAFFCVACFYLFRYIRRTGNNYRSSGYFAELRGSVLERLNPILLLYVILFFTGCVIWLQFQQTNIRFSESTNIYQDLVWHMGITDAISKDFFPICPWSGAGIELKYHFFADLLYGIVKRMTGIPSETLILQGGPYLNAYLYTTSTYALFKELLNKKRASLFFAIAIIPAVFTRTNLIEHILVNTNNVGMALSCLCCILILVKIGLKERTQKYRFWILLALFVYLLTGLKGPFGAVLFVGIAGTCIFAFLLNAKTKKTLFLFTITTAVSFGATYLFVVTGSSTGVGHGARFALGATMKYTNLSDLYYGFMGSDGAIQLLKYGILVLYIALIMWACFFPFLIQFLSEIKRLFINRKPMDEILVLNFAIIIAGFSAWMLLNFDSNNQMYFAFSGVPSLVFLMAWYFTEWKSGTMKKIVCLLSILAILGGCLTAWEKSKEKINALIGEYKYAQSVDYRNDLRRFSHKEYEAMVWLRENTKTDALIAGDRYSLLSMDSYNTEDRFNSRWFYYTAFSQRTFFLEGTGYAGVTGAEQRQELFEINESMYDLNNKEREQTARTQGIDYMVVSERIHPGLDLTGNGISLCYSNEDIRIYRVSN